MILVHAMNGEEMYINPNMIETIRSTPDTVLFLSTNKRIPVSDSPEELVARIVEYRQLVLGKHLNPRMLAEGLAQQDTDNDL